MWTHSKNVAEILEELGAHHVLVDENGLGGVARRRVVALNYDSIRFSHIYQKVRLYERSDVHIIPHCTE